MVMLAIAGFAWVIDGGTTYLHDAKWFGVTYAEDRESDDQEVHDNGDQIAVLDGHFGSGLHHGTVGAHFGDSFLQHDLPLGEINAAGEHGDEGHDDVVDDGSGDLAESAADDNADCHVDHIAAHRKGLEFFKKLLHFKTLRYIYIILYNNSNIKHTKFYKPCKLCYNYNKTLWSFILSQQGRKDDSLQKSSWLSEVSFKTS